MACVGGPRNLDVVDVAGSRLMVPVNPGNGTTEIHRYVVRGSESPYWMYDGIDHVINHEREMWRSVADILRGGRRDKSAPLSPPEE